MVEAKEYPLGSELMFTDFKIFSVINIVYKIPYYLFNSLTVLVHHKLRNYELCQRSSVICIKRIIHLLLQ